MENWHDDVKLASRVLGEHRLVFIHTRDWGLEWVDLSENLNGFGFGSGRDGTFARMADGVMCDLDFFRSYLLLRLTTTRSSYLLTYSHHTVVRMEHGL